MGKKRLVHFVGGPLHGESREVGDGKDRYTIAGEAAHALATAMRGDSDLAEPLATAPLTYTRRKDGRYWLEIVKPEGISDPPQGFEANWFDAGGGDVLLELHAPDSDWGHAIADSTITEEFLGDFVANDAGRALYEFVHPTLEEREKQMVAEMGGPIIADLAHSVITGSATARKLGNRRLVAAMLREFARLRHLEG